MFTSRLVFNKMKKILFGIIALVVSTNQTFADHSTKKMMRNMKAFSQLSVTGKLGPFDVNYYKYGEIPDNKLTSVANKKIDRIPSDKMNLAAIVMRDGNIVYERYATKRKVDSIPRLWACQ